MLSRLSPSQLLIKSISTKDSIYICKLGQNTWTIFSNPTDGDLSKSTIISKQLRDDLVDEYFLLLSGKIILLCLLTRNEVLLINPFTLAKLQTLDNINKFCNGIYHSGLGESLVHNGRDLYSLAPMNGLFQIKEKPWLFYFDNTPWKSWGDFQSEIITNLHTFDSEKALRSSFTLIIEYRVCSTGFPIMHWTTLSPADNKVIINWRVPLLFPDVAVSLFFDNHGVETCLIFSGNVLFIGNAQGLTQAIDWKAFGAITAFGEIHVVGEKCFFLSAYNSGGIHGNEIDLKEGTVAVSPLEGASLYSSVELPIVRNIYPIISDNWKHSNFETFAIIGDPFVGYSFIYTDSFASRASPEFLAAFSRIFDCPSYGAALSLATSPSYIFHTRHALFFEEEVVLQTVRSVHPLRLTGSYIIEGTPLTDFQLIPMENIPSLCSHSSDLLFVLTSRSFSCSSLLRFSDQGVGFEAVPGILVENDTTLAVFKVSDRRVLQVTSRQVQCFSINAAKQFVLETKFDVSYSGKQQFDSNFPSKIIKVARYRETLWLVCDSQCLAKLEISKLPTIEVKFTRLSSSTDNKTTTEISAIDSIRVSISKPTPSTISPNNVEEWLATTFWESNQIQIQRSLSLPSKVENEVTGTLSLPDFNSSQSAFSNHSTIHELQFLSVPNKDYVLLAVSRSDGHFFVYALHGTSSIQTILLISSPLDAHTSEITLLSDNVLLVRTVAMTYYEIILRWESANNKTNQNVDKDHSFPDSISLFSGSIHNDRPHPKLAYTIRTFGDLSCRNLHPFPAGKASHNVCSFIALSSPELLSTGKSHRDLSLQQIPQQQTLLQQLLVIQGEIDLNTQSYQSLAVSERFLKIDDVLLDSLPQQLLVLHWVPPSNYHVDGLTAKGEEEEVTMMQRIDVLDSVSLKPLRHLDLEMASFPSVSRDKVRVSIWSDAMQQLLGDVGIVTSLSAAPTNRYIRDTALMTRHLQRIEYWRYLQQLSVSADNQNKRRGSKNNDQTVVNDNSNNKTESDNAALVADLRPLTLIVVETMKRPIKSQQTQGQEEHDADDDDSEDDSDNDSDSDYDPPDSSPLLDPEITGTSSVERTTADVSEQQQNNSRRKRKASSPTDSSYDSTLHVLSFFYPASDTIPSRNSTTAAASSTVPPLGTDMSHSNLHKLNLIPLDCTQWSLTHCNLLRHRPVCASITTTNYGDHNNNGSNQPESSKNADEHLAILTIDGTLSIVGWTVSLLPTPDSLDTSESTDENAQFTLDDLAKEPLRKGELTLKRLTHMQSSLQPMVPPKYEVDYSDVHRTMETLGKLKEERAWRKLAKPQLICRENIAVVYVPRVGFELFRLVTAIDTQNKEKDTLSSTLELEVCAVIKDTIDFERLFVLTQSNEVGDIAVKIFGHDRMMTRAGREDRAMRLHSFILSADTRYSSSTTNTANNNNNNNNNNVSVGATTAMRRDMFSSLPRRTSSYTTASYSLHPERMTDTADKLGIHTVQWGTTSTGGARSGHSLAFADFVDCMDVEQLLQRCTIVNDNGEMEWGRDSSASTLFVEHL